MTPHDAPEFIARLTLLAEVLSEPMTPTRIAGYAAACDDLDLADLADALNACARTCKYFPRPVEIRDRVREAVSLRAHLERRDRLAQRVIEDPEPPRQLPAPMPPPEMTPEERAARDERIAAGWIALREKWAEVAGHKAMPEAPRSQSVTQIAQWRREGSA